MLVLTQKADDTIHIGNNITVTILRVRGRAVKIGIEAPGDVQVLREPLFAASIARNHRGSSTLEVNDDRTQRKPR